MLYYDHYLRLNETRNDIEDFYRWVRLEWALYKHLKGLDLLTRLPDGLHEGFNEFLESKHGIDQP